MKTALIALFVLLKAPAVRMVSSLKFWTTVIGVTSTYLAQKGIVLDPAMAQYVAGFFALLLAGQAATDHGKAAAEIHADSMKEPTAVVTPPPNEAGFARLGVMLLIAAIGLAACGASAREKTIHATYAGVVAAQAGFEAYNSARQAEIVSSAASEEDGIAQLDKYSKAREPVLKAFEVAYRALAAAAIEQSSPISGALSAAEQLHAALSTLTGGAL